MATGSPRRRGRALPVLLVLLLVLVGLLVVVDRVAAGYAERRLAAEVVREARDEGLGDVDPDVELLGFPFLDQVVRGRYDGVRVTMRDVPTRGLRIGEVRVRVEGIGLPLSTALSGDVGSVRADRVTSTGSVPYSELARAAGAPGLTLTPDGRGRIRATLPLEVAGVEATVTGVADLGVDDGALRLRITELEAEGVDLPGQLEDLVSSRVNERIAVPRLPYGLRLDAVTPGDETVEVRASGRDVLLSAA